MEKMKLNYNVINLDFLAIPPKYLKENPFTRGKF